MTRTNLENVSAFWIDVPNTQVPFPYHPNLCAFTHIIFLICVHLRILYLYSC